MKKILKNKKAITLIALVITIVVLVILAAVTISLTVGNDGLISRALKAAKDYRDAQEKDKQSINDLYGQLVVAADGTVTMDATQLREIISAQIEDETKELRDKVEEQETEITKLKQGNVPAGTVVAYMNTTPPTGYLECNGQTVSRTEYAALFSAIGTKYGAGDGSTTFKLPDLRGEFLRGTGNNTHTWTDLYGNTVAEGSGSSVGGHQSATQHTAIWANDTRTIVADGLTGAMPQADKYTTINMKSTRVSSNSSQNNAMSIFFTSRPTNTSVLYCIKY